MTVETPVQVSDATSIEVKNHDGFTLFVIQQETESETTELVLTGDEVDGLVNVAMDVFTEE